MSNAERVRQALESIIANDRTRYGHHEARPSDGKKPREVGTGSIWLTPKEIARAVLALPPDEPGAEATALRAERDALAARVGVTQNIVAEMHDDATKPKGGQTVGVRRMPVPISVIKELRDALGPEQGAYTSEAMAEMYDKMNRIESERDAARSALAVAEGERDAAHAAGLREGIERAAVLCDESADSNVDIIGGHRYLRQYGDRGIGKRVRALLPPDATADNAGKGTR